MGNVVDGEWLRSTFHDPDGLPVEELTESLRLHRQETADTWARVKADPVKAFSDRANWPPALDYEQAQATTEQWAVDQTLGVVIGYSGIYPLPIGTDSILAGLRDHTDFDSGGIALAGTAPFSGDQWTAWVFAANVGNATVECFGLVDRHVDPDDESLTWFTLGRCAFRITATGTPSREANTLCKHISDWWLKLGGTRLAGGRPPGTGHWTSARFLGTLREYMETNGGPVGRDAFLDHLGMPLSSWKYNKKRWGKSWQELCDEASQGAG